MIHISAVITGHREGLLSGPSITSFRESISHARERGLNVEPLIVLDRSDQLTRSMFENVIGDDSRVITTDFGDPALARNHGAEQAKGEFVTFLDADDLWSFNWLTAAYEYYSLLGRDVVLHSELNIIFGNERLFWLHADSEQKDFDRDYLQIGNYWDALSFAPRQTYLKTPFRKNELLLGYGHEDWHWNCMTLAEGYAHKPVPGTIHVKRRRHGSQSARANSSDVVPWPTELVRF
ncbi:Glycosyl transferase family 2 [Caballeronia terrestris]|uniref:Glycosyl transferase family 2 n=1 Tax=Caballeronia terrestris TaxID=1226301 RepID=A0A158F8C5_9BURK|nr:glycosyltransferase family 2 protein [Caballeronia terrestris]SAL16116.1 Glycosyl transferase family 2 [Caballeronia terrestris]